MGEIAGLSVLGLRIIRYKHKLENKMKNKVLYYIIAPYKVYTTGQWSQNFLVPGAGSLEDNFSMDPGVGGA